MRCSRNKLAVLVTMATVPLLFVASAWAESPLPKFNPKDMAPLLHGPNWVDLDGSPALDGYNYEPANR